MKKWSIVLALTLLCGCGEEEYTPYAQAARANARIIVHASSTDWDIFLDGQHLGRISWSQPYDISSGAHVLSVQRAGGVATRADRAELSFTIEPGQTMEFNVFIDAAGFSRLVVLEG